MRRTNLIAILAGFAAVVTLTQGTFARGRMYHPGLGVFMQRDPAGTALEPPLARNLFRSQFTRRDPTEQYRDGPNLYQYVWSNPVRYVDPMGLWGKDVHKDLTQQLATAAGIACAGDVAAGANRPDEEYWRRSGGIGVADIVALQALGSDIREYKVNRMAEWHFPADADGVVRPDSDVANAKVNAGIKTCDFRLFSEGLHVLQDSWAHQGTPYLWGKIGHGRGAKEVNDWGWFRTWYGWDYGIVGSHWERTDGTWEAATSDSADRVDLWPKSARATGMATYKALVRFRNACPCHCPGPNNTKVTTSSGDAKDDAAIEEMLLNRFKGDGLE